MAWAVQNIDTVAYTSYVFVIAEASIVVCGVCGVESIFTRLVNLCDHSGTSGNGPFPKSNIAGKVEFDIWLVRYSRREDHGCPVEMNLDS